MKLYRFGSTFSAVNWLQVSSDLQQYKFDEARRDIVGALAKPEFKRFVTERDLFFLPSLNVETQVRHALEPDSQQYHYDLVRGYGKMQSIVYSLLKTGDVKGEAIPEGEAVPSPIDIRVRVLIDLLAVLFAVAVAVFTILRTQYLDRPFGTWPDYLTLVLISGAAPVVSTGLVEAIARLFDRRRTGSTLITAYVAYSSGSVDGACCARTQPPYCQGAFRAQQRFARKEVTLTNETVRAASVVSSRFARPQKEVKGVSQSSP